MTQNTPIPILRQSPTPPRATAHLPLRSAGLPGSIAGPLPTTRAPARSLYIHVPFCFHKCHYCDFYSIVDSRDRQEAFTERLILELSALAPWSRGSETAGAGGGDPLHTIFVGGGTPSLLRPQLWRLLLEALDRHFDLSAICAGRGEFTVECNPETVTPELMDILVAGGVDRVSMGAQSFNAAHLKTLERWHDPASVERAMGIAGRAGIRRRSLDLIFGIPGQTLAQWRSDLEAGLAIGTEHLSCYNLTYEPKTAMTARLARGEFARADEDLEVEMYALTLGLLRAHGFERYEVSNYAKPGCESRHNLVYWRAGDWLAAGPSASAHIAGHRWKNIPRLDEYLEGGDSGGFSPITDHEGPDPARALAERVMTGLRLSEGLDGASIIDAAASLDPAAPARIGTVLDRVSSRALLRVDGGEGGEVGRWALTDAGFLLADGIAADLMGAITGD